MYVSLYRRFKGIVAFQSSHFASHSITPILIKFGGIICDCAKICPHLMSPSGQSPHNWFPDLGQNQQLVTINKVDSEWAKMNPSRDKYNTSRAFLENELFKVVPPKESSVHWPVLNITVLPDFLAYLKTLMSEQERILLSEYNAQTYLLEAAFQLAPNMDFDELTENVLSHLRGSNRYWVRKMGVEEDKLCRHHAIEEFHKDMNQIEAENSTDKYPLQPFKVSQDKIIPENYTYEGNPLIKSAPKFSATLFTSMIKYCLNPGGQAIESEIQQDRTFFFELIVHFALRHKPKQKKLYLGVVLPTMEEKSAISEGEKTMDQFEQWLDGFDVDYKCLSNQKDYYLALNMIKIFKSIKSVNALAQNQQNILTASQFEELQSCCANRVYLKNQCQDLALFIVKNLKQKLIQVAKERQKKQQESKQLWKGFLSTPEQIEEAFNLYQEIIAHPENTNQTKYKVSGSEVPWTEEMYQKFLVNFKDLFNVPTNNKKIAIGMGKDIEPSHVKYVKGIYMRNMAQRMDNGEIGGGKKGIFDSKFNFLERDIESFNMRWFKKDLKSKSKKSKKRRKRPNLNGDQEDSDY